MLELYQEAFEEFGRVQHDAQSRRRKVFLGPLHNLAPSYLMNMCQPVMRNLYRRYPARRANVNLIHSMQNGYIFNDQNHINLDHPIM